MWITFLSNFRRNLVCLRPRNQNCFSRHQLDQDSVQDNQLNQQIANVIRLRVAYFSDKTTHFGFEDVEEDVKSKKGMFLHHCS